MRMPCAPMPCKRRRTCSLNWVPGVGYRVPTTHFHPCSVFLMTNSTDTPPHLRQNGPQSPLRTQPASQIHIFSQIFKNTDKRQKKSVTTPTPLCEQSRWLKKRTI